MKKLLNGSILLNKIVTFDSLNFEVPSDCDT